MKLSSILGYTKAIIAAVGSTATIVVGTVPSSPAVQHWGVVAGAAATVLGVLLGPANRTSKVTQVEETAKSLEQLLPADAAAKLDLILAAVTPPPPPDAPPNPILDDALAALTKALA